MNIAVNSTSKTKATTDYDVIIVGAYEGFALASPRSYPRYGQSDTF
jgi:hypothetical protein